MKRKYKWNQTYVFILYWKIRISHSLKVTQLAVTLVEKWIWWTLANTEKSLLLSSHICLLNIFLNACLDKWCVINKSTAENHLSALYLNRGHFKTFQEKSSYPVLIMKGGGYHNKEFRKALKENLCVTLYL